MAPKTTPCQTMLGKVGKIRKIMALAGVIMFSTFANMVWGGIVFDTILGKVELGKQHYQEYVAK
jgi:hypothetical protein